MRSLVLPIPPLHDSSRLHKRATPQDADIKLKIFTASGRMMLKPMPFPNETLTVSGPRPVPSQQSA